MAPRNLIGRKIQKSCPTGGYVAYPTGVTSYTLQVRSRYHFLSLFVTKHKPTTQISSLSRMQRTRVYDVYLPGQTMEETTWNKFKRSVSRGDKFMLEYILDDGKSIFRTIQRLPAAAEDGTISRADLTRRYADLKTLLVDGGMFDPTVRSHNDVWESDTWDDMHTQVFAINSVKIWRWEPVASGGGARSVMKNRTPAFFPFLVHADVPYDLTHLQLYRAVDLRPEREQTCLIYSIITGSKDLGIEIDARTMSSIILRYVKGGMGNTSTVHLSDIGRALGVRFRLTRQAKNGKRENTIVVKNVSEYRPSTADAENWSVIPLALHRGHIFYNKALPPCSTHTVISVDCKNDPNHALARGLVPRPKNKNTRLPREEIRDSLWLIQQLEKFGYISPEVVDPRVIIDHFDLALKTSDKSSRAQAKERCDRIAFDNIPWPDRQLPVKPSVKATRLPKPSNKIEQKQIKAPSVCSYDYKAQKKPPGWRTLGGASLSGGLGSNQSRNKGNPSPLKLRLQDIDSKHTYYWAADTEATTSANHELYLWGAAPLDPLHESKDTVDIQTDVLTGLSNIAQEYKRDLDAFYKQQKTFIRNKKSPKILAEWNIFQSRLHQCSATLDSLHLVKVVIYLHNLRYDRAVLEEHLLVYDVLERETTIYEMKIKHPDHPDILFVLRDSSKHLTGMSVDQMPSKMGLPAGLGKKSKAIYYDFFKQTTRGAGTSVRSYIEARPNKLQSDDEAVTDVNSMLLDFFRDSGDSGEFNPLGLDDVFYPDILYRWYLKYDVLVLLEALRSYELALLAVSQDHLSVNSQYRPLHYPTISSYSRALLTSAGAFDECVKYGLGLRSYIQKAVRGGRTSCHEEFEGKVASFPGGLDDLDGVSLYPSAIASLPGFPVGMPQPIPNKSLDIDSITSEAHTAVVTVRINDIRRKVRYMQPIIAHRDELGVMSFIQDLPNGQPFIDTIHLIDLQEYIRIHDISYEILYGVWWHKRPHVLYTEDLGEGQKCQIWAPSEEELAPNDTWPKFALKLHEARKAAKEMYKKTGNIFYKIQAEMLKLIANSGYGGTVLRISEVETNVRVRDQTVAEDNENEDGEVKETTRTETFLFNNHGSIHSFRETPRNVFIQQHQSDHSSSYNIMGVMILAQSRRNLNRVLESYEACGAYHVYGDTDSIHGPRALTMDVAAHYDEHRDPGYPTLIGTELLQFHVDFGTGDFAIYPNGFLDNEISTWPREAKESDIYSSKMLVVRKKVYLHLLSVDYKVTCPDTGETLSKRAFGLACRCKGLTKKGLYRQAYLLGKSYQDGLAEDPYENEDLDYTDPTSRGILSIYKQVLDGYVVPVNLLTDRGDVRFYFKSGSVVTSNVPCSRTLQMSESKRRLVLEPETPAVSPKRICIDSDSMEDDTPISSPTTFICIDMDD